MCVKYPSHLVFKQNHRISFPYTTHFVFAIISVTKLSADCISGTPNLTTIKCLGTVPAEFKPNTGKNKVGPANQTKTLYVPKGCVEIYTDKWAALLKEGNWVVKEWQN